MVWYLCRTGGGGEMNDNIQTLEFINACIKKGSESIAEANERLEEANKYFKMAADAGRIPEKSKIKLVVDNAKED